jgi:hypothetical protein
MAEYPAHLARERGIKSMEGLVLAHNAEMLRFGRVLGFETHAVPEDRTTVRIFKILQDVSAPQARQPSMFDQDQDPILRPPQNEPSTS